MSAKILLNIAHNISPATDGHENNIRVGAFTDYPYVKECFTNTPMCRNPGIEIEFVDTLIREIIHSHISWMKFHSFTELSEAMDKGEINFIGITLQLDTNYTNKWYHTVPITYDIPGFIVKANYNYDTSDNLFTLLSVFSCALWTLIFFVSLLAIAFKKFSTFLKQKFMFIVEKRWFDIKNIFYVLWFTIVGILLNLFGNLIAVRLLRTNFDQPPFDSVEKLGEALAQSICKLATLEAYKDDITFYPYILNPTHNKSWAKYFKTAYQTNPPTYAENRESLGSIIERNTECIIGLDWMSLESFYTEKFCHVKMMTFYHEFLPLMYVYYHRLDDYVRLLNVVPITDSMSNLYATLTKKYKNNQPINCENLQYHPEREPIPWKKLEDCFAVLTGGLFLSFFFFLLQRIRKKYN